MSVAGDDADAVTTGSKPIPVCRNRRERDFDEMEGTIKLDTNSEIMMNIIEYC